MRLSIRLTLLVVLLSLAHPALAQLTSLENGQLVRDEKTGLIWLADIVQFISLTYDQQVAAVAALSMPNYKFRLATVEEVKTLFDNHGAAISASPITSTKTASSGNPVWCGRTSTLASNPSPDCLPGVEHVSPCLEYPVYTYPYWTVEDYSPSCDIFPHNARGVWVIAVPKPFPDTDDDGVDDFTDQCPNSILAPTVVINECDSGVPNHLYGTGCTLSDLISEAVASAENQCHFVGAVGFITLQAMKSGVISGNQKGAIQKCAAKATKP